METLPLVPVAAYISYDITYTWALQYVHVISIMVCKQLPDLN